MRKNGFSLIEVVIALGVTTVALVGTLPVMQIGLASYRDAMNDTIVATIDQQVLSQYLLAGFENIKDLPPQTKRYDERGLLLGANDGEEKTIYQSVSRILPPADLGLSSDDLVKLEVKVSSPTQPELQNTFTSLIARHGKDTP